MQTWLSNYVAAQHRVLDSIPLDSVAAMIETLRQAWRDDKQIFAIGNGGNSASASHFATDLGKGASDALGKRFRIMTLADNVARRTAIGNDYSYDDIMLCYAFMEDTARPGVSR